MKAVKHYIFTRFNAGIYEREDAEAWMEHRMDLFETYTLPAMQCQTCQDFTWLLYFDDRTPNDIICKYDYIDNVQIIYEYHKDWIQTEVIDNPWVLTSRIDNDDYYENTFVEQVQDVAYDYVKTGKEPLVIDVGGLQYAHKTGKFYTNERERANSPFISLLERNRGELYTVYHCPHTHMPDEFASMKIYDNLSVMVIHDKNVTNRIIGTEL